MNPLPPHADSRILVVDDEAANVALLQVILESTGYKNIRTTLDSRRVIPLLHEFKPDLILLDLMMPNLSGFDVLERLATEVPTEDFVPVLVLTADAVTKSRHRALAAGASDFITKPFDQTEALLRIRNLLRMRAQHLEIRGQTQTLELTVQERTRELRDTLDRLQNTQQQIISHERLSALGAMAAGIAHDFNNALFLILGYGELLLEDVNSLPGSKNAAEHLGVIVTAAQDAAKMFQRLRDFQRPASPGQFVSGLDLNVLVEQAIRLTRPRWRDQAQANGADIQVEVEVGELPHVTGDPAGLRDVLTNLIFNAVDALPNGGIITIRTQTVAGGGVRLEVSDNGIGMDEATRCRCLEPFFTTKRDKGTGLGLASVYGAVNRHSGSLDIRSTPGLGTTLCIDLPVVNEAVPVIATIPGGERPLRILVVDDQLVYRDLLQQILVGGWHKVETAVSGEAALAKLATNTFDVVITDFTMPGMNGDELAACVKQRAPRTRVILLTGFDTYREKAEEALSAIDLILAKPILNAALHHALTQVMDTLSPAERDEAERHHPDPEEGVCAFLQSAS